MYKYIYLLHFQSNYTINSKRINSSIDFNRFNSIDSNSDEIVEGKTRIQVADRSIKICFIKYIGTRKQCSMCCSIHRYMLFEFITMLDVKLLYIPFVLNEFIVEWDNIFAYFFVPHSASSL
jgi:hypothetical protein